MLQLQIETSIKGYNQHMRDSRLQLLKLIEIILRKPHTLHGSVLFIFFVMNEIISWPLLRLWNVYNAESDFIDLRWLWYSAECYNDVGLEIYGIKGTYCGGYQYGILPIKFINFFNISELWVQVLGYSMIAFFCFLMSNYLYPLCALTPYKNTLFYLVSTSPVMMLFVQRGQIDLLVTFSIFLSLKVSLMPKASWTLAIGSVILLILVTLIKIYPILILFLMSILSKKLLLKFIHLLPIPILLPYLVKDLSLIPLKINSYVDGTSMTFGYLNIATQISNTQSFQLSRLEIMIVSLVLHLLLLFAVLMIFNKKFSPIKQKEALGSNIAAPYSVWTITFLSCYFLGNNIDFRQIFAMLAIFYLCRAISDAKGAQQLLTLLVFNNYLSYQSGGMEVFGDISIALTATILACYLVWDLLVKQKREKATDVTL